jgi:parvulin-like peptidyl-prolyl isomerase
MTFNLPMLAVLLGAGFYLYPVQAEDSTLTNKSPTSLDEPFAIQGAAVLTQAEIDAAFSKIPSEHRLAFIRSGERVNQLVVSLLRSKLVAMEATAADYNEESLVQTRMALAAERELAEAWMGQVIENAPEADYETLAYENYLANPDKYKTGALVDVSHILVSSENRSSDEALALATRLRQQLLENPGEFDSLVQEFSEDPGKVGNKGRYLKVKRGQMVQPFEDMAFSLKEPGEISEPVETAYGYHIIRLDQAYPAALIPFEEIKAQAMAQAKAEHQAEYRMRYLKELSSTPIELPDGAVEAMARRHFGDDFELVPNFEE